MKIWEVEIVNKLEGLDRTPWTKLNVIAESAEEAIQKALAYKKLDFKETKKIKWAVSNAKFLLEVDVE